MKRILIFLIGALLGAILFSGCTSSDQPRTPTAIPPLPTPTEVMILPTPSTAGDSVSWRDLQVSMDQVELTDSFITEFGSQRVPSPGQKFLWVQVQLKNVGENEVDLPNAEHFSVLYGNSELKPTYGHRQDHPDYTAVDSPLVPAQTLAVWLRFDVPVAAGLKDLRFVFLPESAQVGVLSSSPTYPWGGEHPIFVWVCAP